MSSAALDALMGDCAVLPMLCAEFKLAVMEQNQTLAVVNSDSLPLQSLLLNVVVDQPILVAELLQTLLYKMLNKKIVR
jgi:hypothetical protein